MEFGGDGEQGKACSKLVLEETAPGPGIPCFFPPYIMSQSSLFCPRNRSPTTCPCPHINLCLSHF